MSKEDRGKQDRQYYESFLTSLSAEDVSSTDKVLKTLPWLAEWHEKFMGAVRKSRETDGAQGRSITAITRQMVNLVGRVVVPDPSCADRHT